MDHTKKGRGLRSIKLETKKGKLNGQHRNTNDSKRLLWATQKAMATHSSTLAWKISWTEEPGRLQSIGSLRVGHNWATSLSLFTFMHWRRKWQPTPVFLPGQPRNRGAWWAAIYGVTQSQTRLKWLSSSSIEMIIWFLSFNLLIWCITLIDVCIFENPCIPGINSTWSCCMSFLLCCWIFLLEFFWGFLHICSSVILAGSFLFLCCCCLVLVSGWWWPHRMSLEVFLPLQFSERVLEGYALALL